jgi:hypothetical protein
MKFRQVSLFSLAAIVAALLASCSRSDEDAKSTPILLREFDASIDCVDLTANILSGEEERKPFVDYFVADAEASDYKVEYYKAVRSKDPEHILYVFADRSWSDVYMVYALDAGKLESASKFHFGSLHYPQSNEGCKGVPGSGDWRAWERIGEGLEKSNVQ